MDEYNLEKWRERSCHGPPFTLVASGVLLPTCWPQPSHWRRIHRQPHQPETIINSYIYIFISIINPYTGCQLSNSGSPSRKNIHSKSKNDRHEGTIDHQPATDRCVWKNRVIIPSIPSFVIPSQNCHNMKGHLSFCKHKPAGFLRKFGLTVFSILIVWTHTACFLFILTDTSTYFHHLGLFHLSGSKPLDSRSLSRKNWPVMLNPGLCQSQLERWPILIPKVKAFFVGFAKKYGFTLLFFCLPGGWARWINSCGWTVQRLVSLTRKRPTGDLVSCGEGGEKKEWLPWENRMLEPFRKPHPAAIFSCFQYWKGKHAETVMISCGLSIPAIARAFLRTIGVSQGGMRPSQVCISSGYSWTPNDFPKLSSLVSLSLRLLIAAVAVAAIAVLAMVIAVAAPGRKKSWWKLLPRPFG